jgi:uncharacterized protein (DUF427 family)
VTAETTSTRGRVRLERSPKRVRTFLHGVAVADTTNAMLVWEGPNYPAYYIPIVDVRMELLTPTATVTHSPSRGDARHFTVAIDGLARVDAAWQYWNSSFDELRDRIRFDWGAMDAWFEEDEEVYVHVRNPYTRVDILPSSRHVRVELDGVVLAESARTHALFETGLPTRWYFPKTDVRMDLLEHTDSVTGCPYKGEAEYWTARVGDRVEADVAWSYRRPLPESERIAGLVAFYNDRVALVIDNRSERTDSQG